MTWWPKPTKTPTIIDANTPMILKVDVLTVGMVEEMVAGIRIEVVAAGMVDKTVAMVAETITNVVGAVGMVDRTVGMVVEVGEVMAAEAATDKTTAVDITIIIREVVEEAMAVVAEVGTVMVEVARSKLPT